jgi:hypothetical protein
VTNGIPLVATTLTVTIVNSVQTLKALYFLVVAVAIVSLGNRTESNHAQLPTQFEAAPLTSLDHPSETTRLFPVAARITPCVEAPF